MGIQFDYVVNGDGYYYNDGDENKRFSTNGEKCTNSNGVMSDIDMAKKITRWTRCSFEDLEHYISNNGGKQFCLYVHTKFNHHLGGPLIKSERSK